MRIKILAGLIFIYLIGGCASTHLAMKCTPSMIRQGYFCYGGVNFGKNLSPMFKRGVIDGCRTGQGYFFKDYIAFRSSKEYQRGWIEGRKKCRPNYDDRYMNQTSNSQTKNRFDDGLEDFPRSYI